jgi:hypothetical protein
VALCLEVMLKGGVRIREIWLIVHFPLLFCSYNKIQMNLWGNAVSYTKSRLHKIVSINVLVRQYYDKIISIRKINLISKAMTIGKLCSNSIL